MRRALWTFLVALFYMLLPGAARADASARPSEAWLLEDLGEEQRKKLAEIDKDNTEKKSADDIALPLRELASIGGWQAAALVEIIDPRSRDQDEKRESIDKLIKEVIVAGKPKKPCSAIVNRIEEQLGPRPLAPKASTSSSPCPSVDPKIEKDLEGYVFVRILGTPKAEIHILTGGPKPEYFKLGESNKYEVSADRAVYLTLVRRDVPVTVRLHDDEHFAAPIVWSYVSQDDQPFEGVPRDLGCINLSLNMLPGDVALLNGHPIDPSKHLLDVLPQRYELVVLRPAKDAEVAPNVILRHFIETEELRGAVACRRISYDFSIFTNKEGKKPGLSLVDANVSDRCTEAGLDRTTVHELANAFLDKTANDSKDFKLLDFNGWSLTVKGVSDIQSVMTRLPGSAAGAATGRLDTVEQLSTGAREMLRQGFGTLVSVELQCAKNSHSSWEYSVIARRLDLGGARDPVGGINLSSNLRTEGDTVHEIADLAVALRAALSRLLGRPYVRFARAPEEDLLTSKLRYDLEIFTPRKPGVWGRGRRQATRSPIVQPEKNAASRKLDVTLQGKRLNEDEAATYCQPLSSLHSREHKSPPGMMAMESVAVTLETDETNKGDGVKTPAQIPFNPPRAGIYFLEVDLTEEDHPELRLARTQRCVTIREPTRRIWADVGYQKSIGTIWPEARDEQFNYFQIMAGMSFQLELGSPWWFGFAGGYTRATHVRSAPPSWQDLLNQGDASTQGSTASNSNLDFDSFGRIGYSWVRQSFVLGPTVSFRAPLCTLCKRSPHWLRHIDGFVRAMVLLDVGLIDTNDVPAAFNDFLRGARGADIDVSTFAQLGISVAADDRIRLYLAVDLGMVGFDDLFFNNTPQQTRETFRWINGDAAPVIGGVFGGEFGP